MTEMFKMTEEKRAALIGKTIADFSVKVGEDTGTSFTIFFTDGSSVYVESEGYEGVGLTVSDQSA